MSHANFEQARQHLIDRLARELSPAVTYHSLAHTLEEVFPTADQFAALENVAGEDLLLLRTAAVYNDAGFVEQHHDHEEGSARIAAAALPDFGYTPDQIAVISGIIMATRLPQTPHTLLEQIMADADLSVLGRANYLLRNAALRQELASFGQVMTDEQWYGRQYKFIRDHRYFRATASRLLVTNVATAGSPD